MNKAVIDTNVYCAFKNRESGAVKALREIAEILICVTVIGELYCGFKGGTKEKRNIKELEEFLDSPRATIVINDETTAEFYSDIYRNLRNKGKPIPTNDMWIAATAMQNGAAVCTSDRHFKHIDGLSVMLVQE